MENMRTGTKLVITMEGPAKSPKCQLKKGRNWMLLDVLKNCNYKMLVKETG